jgi:hypothetical protein
MIHRHPSARTIECASDHMGAGSGVESVGTVRPHNLGRRHPVRQFGEAEQPPVNAAPGTWL